MKSALIFFLIGLVMILGFNIYTSRKELRDTILGIFFKFWYCSKR